MNRIIFLLLFVTSLTFGQNKGHFAAPSAASYSQVTYSGSKIAWIYVPAAYNRNSNNYPLIVFFPGYGATDRSGGSFANVNNSGEGLGQYLTSGDQPPGVIICIPQNLISGTDYGHAEWDAAITYMAANYRIDANRMYATGLSGGAIASFDVLQNRTNLAATVSVSGPSFSTSWSSFQGIGAWFHQGTTDATFGRTIGGSLFWATGGSGSANNFVPAVRSTYYYNLGHVSGVWDTQVYNRLERTDATGTAAFDFVRWLKKYSLDATQQATLFTENAEYSIDIVDYREALELVNNISSGSPKTSLLSRLATLKTSVDRSGTRYIVSCNHSGTTVSTTGINDWNATFAATQGLTNIVDDTGSSSTVGFTVTNQFASSSRDANVDNSNAGRLTAKGFPVNFNLGGLVLNNAITNGRITINNIPSGKKIDVIIHHYHIAGDDDGSAMSAQSAISATMNGITKTQYSAYNNAYYLKFTDVPESSGSATLDMKTVSTRNVVVTGFEILIHP